jgi:hypothetical protein
MPANLRFRGQPDPAHKVEAPRPLRGDDTKWPTQGKSVWVRKPLPLMMVTLHIYTHHFHSCKRDSSRRTAWRIGRFLCCLSYRNTRYPWRIICFNYPFLSRYAMLMRVARMQVLRSVVLSVVYTVLSECTYWRQYSTIPVSLMVLMSMFFAILSRDDAHLPSLRIMLRTSFLSLNNTGYGSHLSNSPCLLALA